MNPLNFLPIIFLLIKNKDQIIELWQKIEPLLKEIFPQLEPPPDDPTQHFDLRWVQETLNMLGESLDVDGEMGPATKAAIEKFQTKHGLEVDGDPGPITRAWLYSERQKLEDNMITEEAGKTARSFFEVLRESPLSLALVAVIAGLVLLLYYSQTSMLEQRRETSGLIIAWQRDTDKLMASCVSMEVTKLMLDNMQKITETMLLTAQKDIERMQKAIEAEREQNRILIDQAMKRFQRYVPPPGIPFKSVPAGDSGD